jgi:Type IV pili methyl-accepting chemotaxis transducer N-term
MQRRSLILSSLALPTLTHAQVGNLSDAINKAGRQRMLSQRMSKSWFALLLQIDTAQAKQVMERSMALFDKQLAELRAYSSTSDLKQTYQSLDAAWGDFRATLVGQAPNRDNAAKLIELDSTVLRLANQGTGLFEALSTRPTGRLVNMAGRQRMLSQRMAKFYLAAVTPIAAEASRAELLKARLEFLAAMNMLKAAPEATARIKEEITLAENQWVFFDISMQKLGAPAGSDIRAHSDVFIASENLLISMDRVTSLYAAMQS